MLNHDTMTTLHSRDFMMNTLDNLSETSSPFILLAFDLNKFKIINDTLGHNAGDELLKHFALQLKNTLGQYGKAGRVGGDEFLWVFESTDHKLVNHYYGEFLLAMKRPCQFEGHSIQASVSTGGVISTNCDNHIACVLEQADNAMYEAKRQKLNTIFWCNQDKTLSEKQPKPIAVPLPA
jgi:diguanylate cyclase (GGDEF)-like protein